jgi:hypothetical protein
VCKSVLLKIQDQYVTSDVEDYVHSIHWGTLLSLPTYSRFPAPSSSSTPGVGEPSNVFVRSAGRPRLVSRSIDVDDGPASFTSDMRLLIEELEGDLGDSGPTEGRRYLSN